MLKILWSSVTPTIESGYGRVSREVVSRLVNRGFDVMVHGYQTMGKLHTIDGTFKMLDCGGDEYGLNVLPKYFKKYNRDVLITLYDVWAFFGKVDYLCLPWIAYFPIDAEPVSTPMSEPIKYALARAVYSQFAKKELEKVGIDSDILNHGVDTKVFKSFSEEERKELRKKKGIPEDAFLIGTNGANAWDRKDFPRMIRIFAEFVKKNNATNALFYLHANAEGVMGKAFSLMELAKLYGIEKQIRVPEGKSAISDEDLVKMYNTFDVYFTASRGEGCGLPILEAQSCGVPAIVPNNSAQPEWVEGHGWVVSCTDHIVVLTTPLHNKWYLMDIDKAVEALTEAYQNKELRKKYGEMSREEMLKYDWDKVVDEQWIPFLNKVEEQIKNPFDKKYFEIRNDADRALNFHQVMDEISGDSVLEVGCGDGALLKVLKDREYDVKGLDISEEAVRLTKEKEIECFQADALEGLRKIPSKSVDTVISMHLLEHCEDDRAVIAESLRIARNKVIHLIPLGPRYDWTHKRVYTFSDTMMKFRPTRMACYPNGDAVLIFDIIDSERLLEYSWVLNNLEGKRVLDVGTCESNFLQTLNDKYDAYGIDIREYGNPSEKFVKEDIRKTSFEDNFFDNICAVSTLEHIGLGFYGDSKEEDGDRKALLEMERITKLNGVIILTMPFGKKYTSLFYRVYDDKAIKELIEGFTIEKEEYFHRTNKGWSKIIKEEAEKIDTIHLLQYGLICLKLRKT